MVWTALCCGLDSEFGGQGIRGTVYLFRNYGDRNYGDTLLNPQTQHLTPPHRATAPSRTVGRGHGIPCPRNPKNHFPTRRRFAYPARVRWGWPAQRMDRPVVCASRRKGAGDDRRGRPGSTAERSQWQVHHVKSRSAVSKLETGQRAGGIQTSTHCPLLKPQRRRIRAQNAATPRRSSVPPATPRQPSGWPGWGRLHILRASASFDKLRMSGVWVLINHSWHAPQAR